MMLRRFLLGTCFALATWAASAQSITPSSGSPPASGNTTINGVTCALGGSCALPFGFNQVLATATGINVNATGDTSLALDALPTGFTACQNLSLRIRGATGAVSSAHVGLYTAASQGGSTIIAQTQLSSITAVGYNTAAATQTLQSATTTIAYQLSSPLFFNVGTAEGAAGTVDIVLVCAGSLFP